jgi:hypothetical protein
MRAEARSVTSRAYQLAPLLLAALALVACGHLALPATTSVDRPALAAFPWLPDYDDPAWLLGQGQPIARAALREGRSMLPEGGRLFVLPHVLGSLPYKNVQETRAWVDEVNRTYGPVPPWRYRPERRLGHYSCMSVSAATVLDWFHLEEGRALAHYRSWLSGKPERGTDPRLIDSIYLARARDDPSGYPTITAHRDPVEGTPIPWRMEAFAAIVTLAASAGTDRDAPIAVADAALPGVTHRARSGDFLDLRVEPVLRWVPSPRVAATPDAHAARLVAALERYGPLYAGIRVRFAASGGIIAESDLARLALPNVSGHGVVIVGYVEQDGRTYFIYRETFGEADDESEEAGPSYRAYPVHGFNEAYAFVR